MIAEKMKPYVKNNSAIRMMFEEGNRLRAIYGADKVYDFSLGNPSVPAPECVKEAIIDLVNEVEPTVLHGYMSNAGFEPDDCGIFEPPLWDKVCGEESDYDSWSSQRSECDFQDNPESRGRSDCFCTIFSGIWCICAQF